MRSLKGVVGVVAGDRTPAVIGPQQLLAKLNLRHASPTPGVGKRLVKFANLVELLGGERGRSASVVTIRPHFLTLPVPQGPAQQEGSRAWII